MIASSTQRTTQLMLTCSTLMAIRRHCTKCRQGLIGYSCRKQWIAKSIHFKMLVHGAQSHSHRTRTLLDRNGFFASNERTTGALTSTRHDLSQEGSKKSTAKTISTLSHR